MRVNVYGEELTSRIEVVTKKVQCEICEGSGLQPTGVEYMGNTEIGGCPDCQAEGHFTFYGVRFWLKFPNQPWWVHRKVDGEDDDDSSALTIWHHDKDALTVMFQDAIARINEQRVAEWVGGAG